MENGGNFFDLISSLGGIAAFFGVPYLVASRRINKQKFGFIFQSKSGSLTERKSGYLWSISGYCNNKSDKANSIVRIALVVWKNKKKNSYRRFGYDVSKIIDLKFNKEIKLPLYFKNRQSRHLSVDYEITLDGTSDEKIMREVDEIKIGDKIVGSLIKNNYELCFEDVDGNFFSQNGKLVNIEEADYWWLLPNTTTKINDWNFCPFLMQCIKIIKSKIKFFFKKIMWAIGL